MRRIAALAVLAIAIAGAGASGAESSAPVTLARSSAVLAIVPADARDYTRLAWLDPATLKQLPRGSVQLPSGGWSPVLSPARRYVALGGAGTAGIRIVDVRSMKVVARVARQPWNRQVRPLAWLEPRRLLALEYPQSAAGAPEALLAIDPVSKRVLSRTPQRSTGKLWAEWATAKRRLITLIRWNERLAPARLVVFGPGGTMLKTMDVGIVGGVWPEGPPSERIALPALAADPEGSRAFVVDSQTLAEIDLDTLDVSYARLTEARSLFSRFLGWLEPAANAKLIGGGFSRNATWLGNDRLAVSGTTYASGRARPAGLLLADTPAGSARVLEPLATAQRLSQGVLLAFGAERDPATNVATGMGVSAFTTDGRKLWHALGDEPVWVVETAGGYAYVPTPDDSFPTGVRVLDLETGEVLRTVRGELPTFVAID